MNFYFEAAKVLDRLDSKQGSIKGIIATLPEKDRKRTAALVIETLKYKAVLNDVLDAAKLLKEEKKITSRNLALVLLHDLLLAKGIQAGEGAIKQAILRHKTRLHSEFTRIKIKRGAKSNAELAVTGDERAAKIPRYVRINTARWTTAEAITTFTARGYSLDGPFAHSKSFGKDEHIPDLLLFAPNVQFGDDPLCTAGKIILQDKASCFPAFILSPPADHDAVVIDATAAPGNKTSHLAALMKNKGTLHAFERDNRRFKTLKMMVTKAGCTNVRPVNTDFLTISPRDPEYRRVTHIGSGIVNRLDHLLETESESEDDKEARLTKLAAFQLMMIRHAMKFPSVKRVVYSTCSVHAAENEHVVKEALKSEECLNGPFVLAPHGDVLPTWKRRGIPEEMDDPNDAASLIRCSPGEDGTNGFFVSLFVRQGSNMVAEISSNKRKHGAPDDADHDAPNLDTPSRRRSSKKRKKSQTQGHERSC